MKALASACKFLRKCTFTVLQKATVMLPLEYWQCTFFWKLHKGFSKHFWFRNTGNQNNTVMSHWNPWARAMKHHSGCFVLKKFLKERKNCKWLIYNRNVALGGWNLTYLVLPYSELPYIKNRLLKRLSFYTVKLWRSIGHSIQRAKINSSKIQSREKKNNTSCIPREGVH